MQTDEMRRLLAGHDEARADHRAEEVAKTFAGDGVYENFALALRFEGRDAVQLHYAAAYEMTPDMGITPLAELVGHDVLARLELVSGTVKERFLGVEAEGPVEFPSVAVYRFGAGLLSHVGVSYDLDGLCAQLHISSHEVRMNANALRPLLVGATSGQ